ncbi:MAG: helix-turn-helix transcriptional regulator [Ruminococcus sp.]|nr:helix-turn-helix transcriptional regulator [Ruminococcus sp.]
MAWYKRIRDLREDSDKTQTEVAEFLGTTAQYYGKYEKGERELPFMRAIQLAEYYGVSLDYLAGRQKHRDEQSLREDEQNLLHSWHCLSERDKGKVEYLIAELLEAQAQRKEAK